MVDVVRRSGPGFVVAGEGGGRKAAVSSPSGLAPVGLGFVSTPANARATELQTSGGENQEAGRRARVRRAAGSRSGTGMCCGAGCRKEAKGAPQRLKASSSRQAIGRSKRLQNVIRYRRPTSRWLLALCAGREWERQKGKRHRDAQSGNGGRSRSTLQRAVGLAGS